MLPKLFSLLSHLQVHLPVLMIFMFFLQCTLYLYYGNNITMMNTSKIFNNFTIKYDFSNAKKKRLKNIYNFDKYQL